MSDNVTSVYEFAFRGLLTEESLDREGRMSKVLIDMAEREIAESISLDLLDDLNVQNAQRMAVVYTAIAAFENSVRELVQKTLIEKFKENWWEDGVSTPIRERAQRRLDDELKVKWHTQRGQDPINYTTFGDLKNIMKNNWELFDDLIVNLDWATGIFETVERSRNVIMHSGHLAPEDIERLGVNIRDWVKQVGA